MIGKKRVSMMVVMGVLVGLALVGTTLAYLYDQTDILTNAFHPGDLDVEVVENGIDPPPKDDEREMVPVGGSAKKEVQAKNTGTIDSYIRMTLVPAFRVGTPQTSRAGHTDYSDVAAGGRNIVYTVQDEKGETIAHYTLTLQADWAGSWVFDPATHIFYHKKIVPPDNSTDLLLEGVVQTTGDWTGLRIEALADAVQADARENGDAVDLAGWNVSIDSNRELILK